MLILLALILAGPVWNSKINTSINKGWILIEKENLTETYTQFKAEIDSLSRLGYEFHLFEPGFKSAKLQDALKEKTSNRGSGQLLPYWSLIKLLDSEIPESTKALLFTPNRLNRLGAERPLVSHPLTWKTYTPIDSTATWIENAWFTESDSVKAIIAASSPAGTTYNTITIDPASKNTPFAIDIQNGKSSLKFRDNQQGDSLSVNIDTTTIRIAIYTDKFKNDAGYLKAAISAINKYTGRKIKLSEYSTINIPSGQNIIFWLSESAVPPGIIPLNSLFVYEKGKMETVSSRLKLSPAVSVIQKGIDLYKQINYSGSGERGFPVWEDGFGKPVLDLQIENKLSVYHFYSRFNPDWNELVWSDDFPKALIPIILPDENQSEINPSDKSIATDTQTAPVLIKENNRPSDKNQESQKNLKNQFWLALILTFAIERYLTFRNNLI
jgi:hypothetical protein